MYSNVTIFYTVKKANYRAYLDDEDKSVF